ncbi:hypothetical protein [Oceanisphaera sp. IT1-181]|uniref:hypothetical protein n=1 Tax=Oceanisphaera sp. IT1-181 TaxID=3081199 RepID=UPI0029CA9B1D|nr:hypothetical protein [Oceanisphaera sp. IT1-181]
MAQLISRSLLTVSLSLSLLFTALSSQASEQSARWLSNTFRIDPSISSLTLLIERTPNSAPVVLIRPDGSKYYQHEHPDHIGWVSTHDRDVITLWQPEPGPWQATGKVTPKRAITLVSEFELALSPLAERLYQQEVLKLGAELRHGTTRLDANYYLQDLTLQAQLINLRIDPDAQFAPAPVVVGEFKDDGVGLDAIPNDGKLTAQVILDILPGEYLFQTEISNQVLARTKEQQVMIYPMPLKLSFAKPDEQGQWHITVTADQGIIPSSLVITGELVTPSQQRIPITGTGTHISLPDALEPGNYSWQGRAFATNKSDREIQLELVEQVIRVSPAVTASEELIPVKDSNTLTYSIAGVILLLVLALIGCILRNRAVKKRLNSDKTPS